MFFYIKYSINLYNYKEYKVKNKLYLNKSTKGHLS